MAALAKPWFERDPDLYVAVAQAIDHHYPTLHLIREGGVVYVRGRLNIDGPELRAPIASYDIELEFPADYPEGDPLVREVGGLIPKDADHHFFNNSIACLFLPEERWKYCRPGDTIVQFINGPVKGFFAWQAHLALTGKKPPSGEWQHGFGAIFDFYSEQLGTNDPRVVCAFLECMTAKKVKGVWRCYCGSEQQLRQCHFSKVQFLRERIPRKRALVMLQALRQAKAELSK